MPLWITLALLAGCDMLFQLPREKGPPWTIVAQPDAETIPATGWSPDLIDRLLDRQDPVGGRVPSFAAIVEMAGSPIPFETRGDPSTWSTLAAFEGSENVSSSTLLALVLAESSDLTVAAETLRTVSSLTEDPRLREAIRLHVEAIELRADAFDAVGESAMRDASESLRRRAQRVAEADLSSAAELPPPPRSTPVFESYEFLDKGGPAALTTPILSHWRDLIGGLDTNELYRFYDQSTRSEIEASYEEFSRKIRQSIERRRWDAILSSQSRQDARWQERILARVERVHATYFRHYADLEAADDGESDPVGPWRRELTTLGAAPLESVDVLVATEAFGVDGTERDALSPALTALLGGDLILAKRLAEQVSSSTGSTLGTSLVLCVTSLSAARWDLAASHLREASDRGLDAARASVMRDLIARRLGVDPTAPQSTTGSPSTSAADPRIRPVVAAFQRSVEVVRKATHSEFVVEDPDRLLAAWGEVPSQEDLARPLLRGLIDGECWVIPLRADDGEIRFEWTADVAARVDPGLHALVYEAWRRAILEGHRQLAGVSATLSWMARDRLVVREQSFARATRYRHALERELAAAPTSLTLWLAAFSFQPVGGPIDLTISDGVATPWALAKARRFGEASWQAAAIAAEAAAGFAR